MSGGRRIGRILLDVAPLRHDRDYRWLWAGQVVSAMGTQITRLALPFQVYSLTQSTIAIAALTACQLVPILLFALVGGSLADAMDRRRLLLMTQTGSALCSLALVGLATLGEPPLLALFAIAFLAAGLAAVDLPARTASVPRLVPPERLPAAIALNQLSNQAASIVGPAVAGLLLATVGLVGAYVVDVITFSATILALLAIRPLPPLADAARPGIEAIRQGLRFARSRRPILGSFAIDLIATVFGTPTALFPVLALDVFKVGPIGLGMLAAAPAAGAFVGAVFSGWVGRIVRVGLAVVLAVLTWGLAITAFGVTALIATPSAFAIGLLALALAGAADMISAIFRNTIIQLQAPDQLRGRVTSINSLVVTAGPRLGDVESALLAAVIGPAVTIVAGGLLCVAGVGALLRWLPDYAQHVIDRRSVTSST